MPTQEEITHQQNLLVIHRRTLAHYLGQQAALGGPAHAPPGVANGIIDTRSSIQRVKQILRRWNVAVPDHPDDGDETPQPTTPEQSSPPTATPEQISPPVVIDRMKLRQILASYFSEDELRDICFELSIDYENLSGTGKSGKARELVSFAERHRRFQELVDCVQRLRPNIF